MDDEKYQKLKDYALRLLSFRPRTVKEIESKLLQFSIKKGIQRELIDKTIKDLSCRNLINDEQFVIWWVEQRQSFKPKGIRAIKIELIQKGIDRKLIDNVLLKYKTKDSEFETAARIVDKKISSYRNLSYMEKKTKIANFLLRRGFDWDVIYKVIDSILRK
jgi:regulatory protein